MSPRLFTSPPPDRVTCCECGTVFRSHWEPDPEGSVATSMKPCPRCEKNVPVTDIYPALAIFGSQGEVTGYTDPALPNEPLEDDPTWDNGAYSAQQDQVDQVTELMRQQRIGGC